MGLAWNICALLGTLSTFFFNPVFQVSTAKNEINLFNNHILIVAPVTFAPAGAMMPSVEFLSNVTTHLTFRYIRLYGLKFSKEDHIALIHLLYELCMMPDLEVSLVQKFANQLIGLLK